MSMINEYENLLTIAEENARARGVQYLEPLHLVIALLTEPIDRVVRKALTEMMVDYKGLYDEAICLLPTKRCCPRSVSYSHRAKLATEASYDVARQFCHVRVAPIHLMVGILSDPESFGAQLMADYGIERRRVQDMLGQDFNLLYHKALPPRELLGELQLPRLPGRRRIA